MEAAAGAGASKAAEKLPSKFASKLPNMPLAYCLLGDSGASAEENPGYLSARMRAHECTAVSLRGWAEAAHGSDENQECITWRI